MIARGWRAGVSTALLALVALGAAGQEPAPASAGEASVSDQLARLNVTLKELVALMRQQTSGQRIELLMRQVELKRAKLSPLEAELRTSRAAREGAESELRQLQLSLEQSADSIASELDGDGGPEQRQQMERMAEQMDRHFTLQTKLTKERLASIEQRIQALESDASIARAEVEHWEAMVERELQR